MIRQGRPEKLNEDLKRWIVIHQLGSEESLKATEIRDDMPMVIEKKLRNELEDRGLKRTESDLRSDIENLLPGISAIQKYLKPVNERIAKPSPLDDPWHLGKLGDYPLSTEAIPYVLKVKSGHKLGAFTIRQARCVSYLYTTVKNIDLLDSISFRYSLYERICEISDTDYNTTAYDELLSDEKSQRKLVEYFDKEIDYSNFKSYKLAFEEITKVEMAGISVDTTQFYIIDNKIHAVFNNEIGQSIQYLLPVKDIDKFINGLKEQGLLKSRKQTTEGMDIITLKKPMAIEIPSDKLLEVSNERSHSQKVKE